ncbi:zinc-binding dehydrogenase [Providencia alcalifaciens]
MVNKLNLNWPEFLEKYWQKKPVVLKNAFPDFVDPITPDELAGLAMEPEVDSRLVSFIDNKWEASFFFTQKQLRGTLVGDIEDFSRWLPAIKKGLIRPLIDSTLPLSQAAYAHERIANNQARGAIILIP